MKYKVTTIGYWRFEREDGEWDMKDSYWELPYVFHLIGEPTRLANKEIKQTFEVENITSIEQFKKDLARVLVESGDGLHEIIVEKSAFPMLASLFGSRKGVAQP